MRLPLITFVLLLVGLLLLDAEADARSAYDFCSIIQRSDLIRETANTYCPGSTCMRWYDGNDHWGWKSLEVVGQATAEVAVAEHDEAGAVAALVALAAGYPEAEAVGSLAALVVGAFPDADLSGVGLRRPGGGAAAPATASASAAPAALLEVGSVRPNPTTGGASVPLALGREAVVEAALYDVLGRRVAVLHEGPLAAGRHTLALDLSTRPPGAYLVRVAASGEVWTARLTLAR